METAIGLLTQNLSGGTINEGTGGMCMVGSGVGGGAGKLKVSGFLEIRSKSVAFPKHRVAQLCSLPWFEARPYR